VLDVVPFEEEDESPLVGLLGCFVETALPTLDIRQHEVLEATPRLLEC
jgi:hypothetical protein